MAKLPNGVEKLPSGNYRCIANLGTDENGKRIRKSVTRSTPRAARLAADALEEEYSYIKDGNITLGQAMQNYIDSKRNILSPSTIAGYEKMAKRRFKDLQRYNITKITEQDIQLAVNAEAADLSPKTITNAVGFLSAVLKTYRPNFIYTVSKPKKTRKLKTLPEPKVIMTAVKGTDLELPVLLAMWLTLRMSEIRGLRKQDIQGDILTISQVKLTIGDQDVVRQQAKTENSIRKLKVPPYVLNLIDRLPEDQEYLVPIKSTTLSDKFRRLLIKSDVPHIAFHDLRHLAASVMLQLNVPEKYAMERGGWSTDSTLKNVYQHTFSPERQRIDRAIDEYFENIL